MSNYGRAPNQDLGSLGVPFLSIDEDGRSVLNKPLLTETKEDDKPAGVDQPPKPNEDFPDCTTYFYHRWMWIQVNIRARLCLYYMFIWGRVRIPLFLAVVHGICRIST